MEQENALLTVFRSAEGSAEEECADVRALLADNIIAATVVGDDSPGVVAGSWEVRVATADAERALALIDAMPAVFPNNEDPSHELDLVNIYRSESSTGAEMEAMGLKAILESNDIPAVVVGGAMMPNLPVQVRVAREDEARARVIIEEAAAAGPAAADEAELASEA